jgi:type I restriction-modification system DNA methylase subunit
MINQIRDILRKEGITGMDSIKHCLLFMFMKFLTLEKCKQLKIDPIYSFEKISELTDANEMKERVFVKGKMCLVNLLKKDNIFTVDFKLQSNANLKTIIGKISGINFDQLSLKTDIVGIIYELHLKSGTSQAMRDLGQYFTNREVIEWMVKLTNPKISNKKTGEIEKILDPSMGTGGFLTMAIKHLNETNNKIDWATNKNNIYGFDIDENVTQMSLLNAFIETGLLFDKTIIKHDSLHKDYVLEDGTFIDKVDVILANEPFGLKNITHAECCDRIKDLKIRGTKAEPLFLQLMMLSLNPGGRCAVVVPDGVLFNDSNLHTGTREYLVKNLNLKKVTSLNGDFFLNTGVKSSVLYFINDGSTSQVEFSELVMDQGKLKENTIYKVGIKNIVANEYSLFVKKYNTVEEKKLDGIKYMKLGDICELKNGKNITKADLLEGPYPVYGGGQTPMGYHNQYNTEESKIIVSKIGEYAGFVNILKTKCYVTSNGFSLNIISTIKNVDNKYLYYYLKNIQNKIYACQEQTGQPKLNSTLFLELQIPIPSMEKQMEVVETLDIFYEQIERNNQSIKSYERIKKSIVLANTTNCDNMKKLGNICEFKSGKLTSKDIDENGSFPFYNGNAYPNFMSNIQSFSYDNKYILLIKDGGAGQGKYGDNIGLGKVFLVKGKTSGTTSILALFNKDKFIDTCYLYYLLSQNKNTLMDFAKYGVGLGHISQSQLSNYKIPIPSKEIQELIIKECEYWDEQIFRLKKENEKLKNISVIEMYLTGESTKLTQTQVRQVESNDESEQVQFDIESDDEKSVELEIKGKSFIRVGTNVYVKTKKGKGELYGTWNSSTNIVTKVTKEFDV